MLREASGVYPLGNGHTVETWVISPKKLKQWLGFEALEEVPAGTSVGYRLNVGAGDIYWDGSSWVPATTDAHWNTFQIIGSNIQALVLSSFDLKIKVNLRTTDQDGYTKSIVDQNSGLSVY